MKRPIYVAEPPPPAPLTPAGSHDQPQQALVLECDRLLEENNRLRKAIVEETKRIRIALALNSGGDPVAAHLLVVLTSVKVGLDAAVLRADGTLR